MRKVIVATVGTVTDTSITPPEGLVSHLVYWKNYRVAARLFDKLTSRASYETVNISLQP